MSPLKRLPFDAVIAVALIVSSTTPARADCLTIHDRVRINAPNPVWSTILNDLVIVSFEKMAARADLVVDGIVTKMRTFVSDDGCELYTDYAITPIRVLYAKVPVLTDRPMPPQPLLVRRLGGQTLIDGVPVTIQNGDASQFVEGAEYVVFLKSEVKGLHALSDEVNGVFGVQNGHVQSAGRNLTDDYRRFNGTSIEQLQAEVVNARQH